MHECVPTPYSLMHPDEGEGVDVFASIIPTGEEFCSEKRAALWAMYGDTGIGNPDTEYWIRRMKGRYAEIKNEYYLKILGFGYMRSQVMNKGVNINDVSHTTRVKQYGKTTVTDSYGEGALTVTNDLKTANYDPPQNATDGAESFLSDLTKDTGSVTTTDTRIHTVETEVKAGADGQTAGTETTISGGSGLLTESVKKWMDGVTDPYQEFAREFSKLFYWGI